LVFWEFTERTGLNQGLKFEAFKERLKLFVVVLKKWKEELTSDLSGEEDAGPKFGDSTMIKI
jgi:hypothetical protein